MGAGGGLHHAGFETQTTRLHGGSKRLSHSHGIMREGHSGIHEHGVITHFQSLGCMRRTPNASIHHQGGFRQTFPQSAQSFDIS
jgi:hypothetical protein